MAIGKIHPYILNNESKTYGDINTQNYLLDCALGVNPDEIPKIVIEELKNISEETIKHYPSNDDILKNIIELYKGISNLSNENIVLGNGSYGLLCNINSLYLDSDKSILGYSPQFSAYVDDVNYKGAKYKRYLLEETNNYEFILEDFIEVINSTDVDLICIENPNNPTGQIITIKDIEKIVSIAYKRNIAIIIDEAYGDYMEKNNSAISLINDYSNLFVVRTFSKGYGLAGIRMGYAVSSVEGIRQLSKLALSANCNSVARQLAYKQLEIKDFKIKSIDRNILSKELMEKKFKKIKIAHTSPSTPIMLLYIENKNINLHEVLGSVGIASVSGLSYYDLDKNSVRIMLCDNSELLIKLLLKADNILMNKI